MSSERYSESRSIREESRRGSDSFDSPYSQRVNMPIQHSSSSFGGSVDEQRVKDRIRSQDTRLQWVNDPSTGKEKFRVNINIDGFHQNEVNIRVEGNKLLVFGEHLESQNQGSAKKIIEKSYELPHDIDTFSPNVSFPSSTNMQVDFPSRHSNVIIDDGRSSTGLISHYDTTRRTPPRFNQERSSTEYTSTRKIGGGDSSFQRSSSPRTPPRLNQERSSTEYTSTRKIGGGDSSFQRSSSPFTPPRLNQERSSTEYTSTRKIGGGDNSFQRSSSPRAYTSYDDSYGGNNPGRNSTYSSTSQYQTVGNSSPYRRDYNGSTTGSYNNSFNPTYTFDVTSSNSPSRTIFPSTSRGEGGTTREQSYSETHRETQHRRSSPTSGVQSSREVQHQRSGSPSISRSLDEDRFRPILSYGQSSGMSPSTSRNVEVREFSRRVGNTGNNDSTFITREPSLIAHGFNSDAFYRSAFQPQIVNDDFGQKRVEMKLAVGNYQPNEIKVSIDGEDLVVKAEHNDERPPSSSTRAYFYKQITLPSNTDFKSLSTQYHADGKLHITAKLHPEQGSIRYN